MGGISDVKKASMNECNRRHGKEPKTSVGYSRVSNAAGKAVDKDSQITDSSADTNDSPSEASSLRDELATLKKQLANLEGPGATAPDELPVEEDKPSQRKRVAAVALCAENDTEGLEFWSRRTVGKCAPQAQKTQPAVSSPKKRFAVAKDADADSQDSVETQSPIDDDAQAPRQSSSSRSPRSSRSRSPHLAPRNQSHSVRVQESHNDILEKFLTGVIHGKPPGHWGADVKKSAFDACSQASSQASHRRASVGGA